MGLFGSSTRLVESGGSLLSAPWALSIDISGSLLFDGSFEVVCGSWAGSECATRFGGTNWYISYSPSAGVTRAIGVQIEILDGTPCCARIAGYQYLAGPSVSTYVTWYATGGTDFCFDFTGFPYTLEYQEGPSLCNPLAAKTHSGTFTISCIS